MYRYFVFDLERVSVLCVFFLFKNECLFFGLLFWGVGGGGGVQVFHDPE